MVQLLKKKTYDILRWSERYTKTDMVYLASGGFWLNIGQIVSTISTLILIIVLGNILSPATYGTYKFIISFSTLLAISSLNGMSNSVIRSVAQENEGTIFVAIKAKLKWGVIGSILAVISAMYYLIHQANFEIGILLLSIAIFIPFIHTSRIWQEYLNGKHLYKQLSIYSTVLQVLESMIMIGAVLYTQNILALILIYFCTDISLKSIFLFFTLNKFKPNDKIDSGAIKYGKHLSLMGLLNNISNEIDKILMFGLLGPIQLAIYTFSIRPVLELKSLLINIMKISISKLSQRNFTELQKSIPRKVFVFFLFLIPITVLWIFFAPFFYKILFSQYTESIIYSQIFAITLLLFPRSIIEQSLIAHKKNSPLYITKISQPLLKIILLFVLLPLYGIWGAILAFLISEIFHFILLFILFLKEREVAQ